MAGLVFDPTTLQGWRAVQAGDIPSGAGSPLTTKGDLYGYSTQNTRIPVGSDGQVLTADSAQTRGVKWAAGGGDGTISLIDSPGATIGVTNGAGPTTDLDLPASGVAAGTYGSSTQTAQVAVNAEGIVTAASNVAIGGIAGTGLVKLFDTTLGADAATIDTGAGGIAAGHGDLVVWAIVRTADAGATANILVRVNNDSGNNYDNVQVSDNNATLAGAASLAASAWSLPNSHGSGGSAGYPSIARLEIPSYDQTTFNKVGLVHMATLDSTAGNNWVILRGIGWRSTAAISRLAITPSSAANLKAGSRLVIYGAQ